MSEKTKRSLGINWDEFFPGVPITLGDKKILIPAMDTKTAASVTKRLRSIADDVLSAGISVEQIKKMTDFKELLPIVVPIILEKCPDIISDASNIEQDDIDSMPVMEIIKVVAAIIDANIQSKEIFEKNLQSLDEVLTKLLGEEAETENEA